MKIKQSILIALVSSLCLLLFVFSGMLKWIPFFPIDPTILFGLVLVFILFLNNFKKIPKYKGLFGLSILLMFVFFSLYMWTSIYSASESYWKHKTLVLLLDILAFIFPLALFDNHKKFYFFKRFLFLFSVISSATVLLFYATDNMNFLLLHKLRATYNIPNYLDFGIVICLGILVVFEKPSWKNIWIVLLGFIALFTIGSRGPIFFTGIMICCGFYLYKRKLLRRYKSLILYGLLAFVITAVFFTWPGADITLRRFTGMVTNTNDLYNAIRLPEFIVALRVIAESPLLGVGIGGYGIEAYGMDLNSYPHNIFLEAFAETGIFGGLIFCLSIFMMLLLWGSISSWKRKESTLYFILFIFMLLNFQKSGGFISARSLYMFAGIYLAHIRFVSRNLVKPKLYQIKYVKKKE